MAKTLVHNGFSGVTFIKKPTFRYGIRAVPYYQFDGKDLERVKNHLFRCGISSSLSSNKLVIVGTRNCLLITDLLNLDNPWTWALNNIFYKNLHTTPNGVRTLFMLFGDNAHMNREYVDRVIREKVEARLLHHLKRYAEDPSALKILPYYDALYYKFNVKELTCDRCGKKGVEITFIGRYPRRSNLFFLCKGCISYASGRRA